MELRTLRLRAPLEYARKVPYDWPASSPAEGWEDLATFPNAIVDSGKDGPIVVSPLPSPSFAGIARSPGDPFPAEAGERETVPPGVYCFAQRKGVPETAEAIRALIEEFARDAWWERERCKGPVYVRRVREDGALAVQVLRELDTPDGDGAAS
jgi:hypothetical protein